MRRWMFSRLVGTAAVATVSCTNPSEGTPPLALDVRAAAYVVPDSIDVVIANSSAATIWIGVLYCDLQLQRSNPAGWERVERHANSVSGGCDAGAYAFPSKAEIVIAQPIHLWMGPGTYRFILYGAVSNTFKIFTRDAIQ
jgi:hypothetical protein